MIMKSDDFMTIPWKEVNRIFVRNKENIKPYIITLSGLRKISDLINALHASNITRKIISIYDLLSYRIPDLS